MTETDTADAIMLAEISTLIYETATKLFSIPSSTIQVLFQEMILSFATDTLLRSLNEASDISDSLTCAPARPFVELCVCIETFNKRGDMPCRRD